MPQRKTITHIALCMNKKDFLNKTKDDFFKGKRKEKYYGKKLSLLRKKCLSTKSNIVENSAKSPTFRSPFSSMGAYRAEGTYCLLEKLVLQLLLLHYQEKFPMKMCGHAVVNENLW